MPFCHVNDQTLYYELSGSGLPLVFLHHATASGRNWRRQVPSFSQHYQALVYDRPGFGRSPGLEPWPFDYHYRDVADLIGLLDQFSIQQAYLVGHSDGATIALLAAALHPQRVSGLVAEAPHAWVDSPGCPDAIQTFLAGYRRSPGLQLAVARDHGTEEGPQVIERWASRWLDPSFWNWTVAHQLEAVCCPVLVIHGEDDPFFPVSHSRSIAEAVVWGQLEVLAGVGHTPHVEVPGLFNQLALGFLGSLS